jgi:hypothetical protein
MIGMHLHDGSYLADIEDPITGRGELVRLLGTGGEPPRGKLAAWSPSYDESIKKGAFARLDGMRERVELMMEEAFHKREWTKMGIPAKRQRDQEDAVGTLVLEKAEEEVSLGICQPETSKGKIEEQGMVLDVPDLLQLIRAIRGQRVGVDLTKLRDFEEEIRNGYCLTGRVVQAQPRRREAMAVTPTVHFLGVRSRKEASGSTSQ